MGSCPELSVYFTIHLLGRQLTSIVHILSPETDNCPSAEGRMTIENISVKISMKECCLRSGGQPHNPWSLVRHAPKSAIKASKVPVDVSKNTGWVAYSVHHNQMQWQQSILTLVLLNQDMPCLCKQCRSRSVRFEEADWSVSALFQFIIQLMNLYHQPGSSNLIGWKLEVGVAS